MDARKRMREELSKLPGILVSSSIPNNLEINAEGADKGGALLRLAARLGIARESTMGFGDGENDLSMIRMAGIGVAMENGHESVKEAADYITKTKMRQVSRRRSAILQEFRYNRNDGHMRTFR